MGGEVSSLVPAPVAAWPKKKSAKSEPANLNLIPRDNMTRVLAILLVVICAASASAQPLPAGLDPENTLILDTTQGRVVIQLRNDIAPNHAERLKQLTRDHFYDDMPFHRVTEGLWAQTGDEKYGNGTGGSKYPPLKAELSDVPYTRGVVGMVHRRRDLESANTQFFIMLTDDAFLNGKFTVVGEVVSGMDVVDKFKRGGPQAADHDKIVRAQVAADMK
jgi:peptidylprolyl isomerase